MTQNAVAHSLATVAQNSAHSSGQSSLHRSGEKQVNVAKDPLAHLAEHRLQGQLRKPPQPSGVTLQSASVHSRGVQTVVHTPNFAPGALAHTPSWPFVPQQLTLLRQTCPSALHGLPSLPGDRRASGPRWRQEQGHLALRASSSGTSLGPCETGAPPRQCLLLPPVS